jgi:hypothetical protein
LIARSTILNRDTTDKTEGDKWVYLDTSNQQQGPFSTEEIRAWWLSGYFHADLQIKKVSEDNFSALITRSEIIAAPSTAATQYNNNNATAGHYAPQGHYAAQDEYAGEALTPGDEEEYTQVAYFNRLNGRFGGTSGGTYWDKKSLPTDREGRLLAHYMDIDAYQEAMRQRQYQKEMGMLKDEDPLKKVRNKRKVIEQFKKKKEDRKKRRLIQM